MAREQIKADWLNVDPSSLPTSISRAYDAYKSAYAEAKSARADFERAMTEAAGLKPGKRLIFGYNFGKLSIAIVADEGRSPKPSASKPLTMAELLTMAGRGR